jgi:hypothetical protein
MCIPLADPRSPSTTWGRECRNNAPDTTASDTEVSMRVYTSRHLAHTIAILAHGRDKQRRDGGAGGHGKPLDAER